MLSILASCNKINELELAKDDFSTPISINIFEKGIYSTLDANYNFMKMYSEDGETELKRGCVTCAEFRKFKQSDLEIEGFFTDSNSTNSIYIIKYFIGIDLESNKSFYVVWYDDPGIGSFKNWEISDNTKKVVSNLSQKSIQKLFGEYNYFYEKGRATNITIGKLEINTPLFYFPVYFEGLNINYN